MAFSPRPRPRHAAMPYDGPVRGDEHRDRDRTVRGMTSPSRRPYSPPRSAARSAAPAPVSALSSNETGQSAAGAPVTAALRSHEPDDRDKRDDRQGRRPRSPEADNARRGTRHRHRSRDRSRGHRNREPRPSSPSPSHRRRPPSSSRHHSRRTKSGLKIDTYRSDRSPQARGRSIDDIRLSRRDSPARALQAKRPRSPSPSTGDTRPKKSRREQSPHRARVPLPSTSKPSQRPAPASRRSRSPIPSDKRPSGDRYEPRPRNISPPPRRERSPSRSSLHDSASYRGRDTYPPSRRDSRPRYRSPSPNLISSHRRRRSNSRPRRSPARDAPRQPTPPPASRRGSYPPRSPRESRRRDRRRKGKKGDSADPSSGPNSIEVNMSGRGGYRGGYNPQMQATFPIRGQYNQGGPQSDPRRFSYSSGHATPQSSFHESPASQSPYGGSGRGWGGSQQFSPPSQYPPQYSHGGFSPSGPSPQGHYPNPAHSPPFAPPTGPSSHHAHPQSPYRANYRGGGSSSFRGGRGGHRSGSFSSSQWNANMQGGSSQSSPRPIANRPDQNNAPEDVPMEEENPFRPSKDLQVEDTSKSDPIEEQEMPPPARQPPTGPGPKFSFAFKATSKPSVATPKPEISQKFNAAPQRRETQQNEDKDRRDLPRSVPTEPASARGKAENRQPRHDPPPRTEPPIKPQQQAQQQPPSKPAQPRVRMVKKMVKRPLPLNSLEPELAKSESIYYRKPGNESVVGSGTYGKVFKAKHVYTNAMVALKRIRMEGEKDGFPVTAVREIKLLRSMKHINIVKLMEVMVEKNDCFMVFEYLSHDLNGILNHPTFKLDAAQRKHLAMQIYQGLDYLHTRGVLHRDIKAANILVSKDGILKLADFGLARFYEKHHQQDYTNRVITIWYRAPELLLGETQYGPEVDIWSAACVMMEIFTQKAVFAGDGSEINQLDKMYSILGTPTKKAWPKLTDMPWYELLRPGYRKSSVFAEKFKDRLTPAAFELVCKMFQYDPVKRPTAAEVLADPYFTAEEPGPRQAVELEQLTGDWHEFESKAHRRENERKERETRRKAEHARREADRAKRHAEAQRGADESTTTQAAVEKDKKRPLEAAEELPESKRHQTDALSTPPPPPPAADTPPAAT